MDYVHIKALEKYHPGYKDRKLIWAKIFFSMVQGDPDCEMIVNEIDWARLIKFILLELQAQKPIPLDPFYLTKKGFDLKKRPISYTIKELHNFLEVVTKPLHSCNVDIYKEEVYKEDKEKEKDKHFIPYLLINQFKEAYEDYLAMRKKNKFIITERLEKNRLNKLYKHHPDIAVKMLDNATNSSWKDVFPLKPEDPVFRRVNAKKAEKVQKKKMAEFTDSKPLSDDEMIASYKKSKLRMPERLKKRAKELEQMLG